LSHTSISLPADLASQFRFVSSGRALLTVCPRPPTSQHRKVRYGLAGEWVALLSTAAHSYIHTLHCRHDGRTVVYSPLLKHRARWLAASARHWLTLGSLLWHGWMKYAEKNLDSQWKCVHKCQRHTEFICPSEQCVLTTCRVSSVFWRLAEGQNLEYSRKFVLPGLQFCNTDMNFRAAQLGTVSISVNSWTELQPKWIPSKCRSLALSRLILLTWPSN